MAIFSVHVMFSSDIDTTRRVSAATDEWRFYYDKQTKGIKGEGTKNNVIFRLMKDSKELDKVSLPGLNDPKTFDGGFTHVEFHTDETPTGVEVHIEGTDEMMIDRARITKNGKKKQKWGKNGKKGWCLSEDSGDYNGKWKKHTDSCLSGRVFRLDGTTDSAESSHNSYGSMDKVCIDLNTKGVKNEGTKDKVDFKIYSGNTFLHHKILAYADVTHSVLDLSEITMTAGNPTKWFCVKLERESNDRATNMKIQIHGSDALMIDQAIMYRFGNPYEIKRWGNNDNRGWCLSTDPTHINGSWKDHADECSSCIHFGENDIQQLSSC